MYLSIISTLGPRGGVEIGVILRGSYANLPQSLELVWRFFGGFSKLGMALLQLFCLPHGFRVPGGTMETAVPGQSVAFNRACTKSRSSTVNYLVRFNQSRVIRSTLHVFLPEGQQ